MNFSQISCPRLAKAWASKPASRQICASASMAGLSPSSVSPKRIKRMLANAMTPGPRTDAPKPWATPKATCTADAADAADDPASGRFWRTRSAAPKPFCMAKIVVSGPSTGPRLWVAAGTWAALVARTTKSTTSPMSAAVPTALIRRKRRVPSGPVRLSPLALIAATWAEFGSTAQTACPASDSRPA